MSDSVRPHRWQPTRLRRPWDPPGKNTGVGCHLLLQCIKVKSESEVIQSCLTLLDPMDCSPPGSSAHGIFQARVLEWGAIDFSESGLMTPICLALAACWALRQVLYVQFSQKVEGRVMSTAHFTDKETEAQSRQITWRKSHSQWREEPEFRCL